MKRAILFGNGAYQDKSFYKDLLDSSSYFVVAIDGGLNFLDSLDISPDLIIGDLDSVEPEIIKKYEDVETLRFPVKKDKTDTEIALEEVIRRGYYEDVKLVGMLGNRIDHSLSNLLLLERFAREGVRLSISTPEETLLCLEGPAEALLLSQPGKIISLLPLSEEVRGVTISGFEYPLEDATLYKKHPSLGVSNITSEEMQTIQVTSGVLLIVINEKK